MNQSFELAPPSRRENLLPAFVFAFTPALTLFLCVRLFLEGPELALAIALVSFGMAFLAALALPNTSPGRLTLTAESLHLESGSLRVRVPLAALDLDTLRRVDDAGAVHRLVTDSTRAVTISCAGQPVVCVSPLHPEALAGALGAVMTERGGVAPRAAVAAG